MEEKWRNQRCLCCKPFEIEKSAKGGKILNSGHYIFETENGATLLPGGSLVFISYMLTLMGYWEHLDE